jgi:aspartate/methionine/tyrosine aminotransferase
VLVVAVVVVRAKGSVKLFEELVMFAHRHNILLCNDNPYSFILNKDYLSILSIDGAKECAIELNSLSKSQNMAGWRIGMVAGDREYISSILKVKSNMDSGMFFPLQMAAVEALNNPSSWYDRINEVYAVRRKIVEEIMRMLGCSYDESQSGLFLWGRIPDNVQDCSDWVEDILQKAHVFITPGFIFGTNGSRFIRISLCANEKNLNTARDRIAVWLKSNLK